MEIYIACLKNLVTGGVELLHQLCHELNEYEDVQAYIWYEDERDAYIPDEYKGYGNSMVIGTPSKDAILIFPEVWVSKSNSEQYKDYQKVIFWLSVDYYLENIPKSQFMIFPENVIHICQSCYAIDFLREHRIHNPLYVSDYINEEFLNANPSKPKKRQILYNPKKGLDITKKIIAELPDEKFIPIENMTPKQIRELMEESMLYIDFGNHPGKDRIPREAALCGCCVITNRSGSAKYIVDVPINNDYKFNNCFLNLAIEQIKKVLDNYEACNEDFDDYRTIIGKEYHQFRKDVGRFVSELRRRTND